MSVWWCDTAFSRAKTVEGMLVMMRLGWREVGRDGPYLMLLAWW